VLQHPHEFQHKINRSVPLLDLCLSLELCVGRRLGDQIPSTTQDLLRPPHLPILIFPKLPEECNDPSKTVFNLAEIQDKISEWRGQTRHTPSQETTLSGTVTPKVVLIVLDATWKYAKEMHRANDKYYPSHMLRMSLDGNEDLPRDFQPRRFELRTTPNSDETTAWMSTAECVAWIVSRLENRPSIYDVTVQVLDAAVEQHRSFIANNKRNQGVRTVSGQTKKRQRHA
jgi:DTW domain-containing protein YfiP